MWALELCHDNGWGCLPWQYTCTPSFWWQNKPPSRGNWNAWLYQMTWVNSRYDHVGGCSEQIGIQTASLTHHTSILCGLQWWNQLQTLSFRHNQSLTSGGKNDFCRSNAGRLGADEAMVRCWWSGEMVRIWYFRFGVMWRLNPKVCGVCGEDLGKTNTWIHQRFHFELF